MDSKHHELMKRIGFNPQDIMDEGAFNYLYLGDYKGRKSILKVWNTGITYARQRFEADLHAYNGKNLPTSELLNYGESPPWLIYKYVEGTSLKKMIAQGATVDFDSVIEKIVRTHSVRSSSMSLEEYFRQFSPFVDDRFRKIEQLRPDEDETFHMIHRALLLHRTYLEERAREYATDIEIRQVHGDFNDSNVIMDKKGVCRVFIDWEFSHLGSPFLDISQMTNKGDRLSQVILDKYFSAGNVRHDQYLYDFFVNYFLFKIALNHLAYKDMAANRNPLRERIVSSKIRRILQLHGFNPNIDVERIVAF